MRALVLTYFVLSVLGAAGRLVLLARNHYPRARLAVKAWEDVVGVVVALSFALWAAWLLWMRA